MGKYIGVIGTWFIHDIVFNVIELEATTQEQAENELIILEAKQRRKTDTLYSMGSRLIEIEETQQLKQPPKPVFNGFWDRLKFVLGDGHESDVQTIP